MMLQKIKRAITIGIYGLLVLRWCGPRLCVRKFAHQLYGQTIFLLTKDQLNGSRISSSCQYITGLASPAEVNELFGKLYHETSEGKYQLLVRKWYHERGFGDCYITKIADTNEICGVRWLVTPEHVQRLGWKERFPLEEGEYLSENIYTLEKCRRSGAAAASANLVAELFRKLGYKCSKAYTDEKNIPALKLGEKTGDKVYERILERHIFFRVTRRILEQYDPPIPMKAPSDN
jgi:RimJ/RimL family protein N-acetyltransferase